MSDREPAQPSLGENSFAGALPPAELRRRRCAHCGGPFGLTRRQRAGKQFCSAKCMAASGAGGQAPAWPRWLALISRSG